MRVSPIPIAHDSDDGLSTSVSHLQSSVRHHGLGAFLLSNPGNPTGKPVEGAELGEYVRVAREENCLFMMDEFYSHYMYEPSLDGDTRPFHTMSSAEYVDDVDKDPIVIINGMTKNWRLPGWRCCWTPVLCFFCGRCWALFLCFFCSRCCTPGWRCCRTAIWRFFCCRCP